MNFDAPDTAVSPVVAVILMVAITVILSAVIGTFVLDLGQQATGESQSTVGVKTSYDGSKVDVTIVTGSSDQVNVLVNGIEVVNTTNVTAGKTLSAFADPGDTVTVVSVSDSESQVVLQSKIRGSSDTIIGPTDGLVSYWDFDDSVNTSSAEDLKGNHDGKIEGAEYVSAGKSGSALDFNETTDNVNLTDVMFDGWSTFTVSVWINPDSLSSSGFTGHSADGGYVFHKTSDSGDDSLGLTVQTNGTAYYIDDGSHESDTSSFVPPTNSWTHLVITYNGSVKELYVNGTKINSWSAASGSLINNTIPTRIGARPERNAVMDGQIDEVRVYNRTLNDSEVQSLYDSEN